MYHAPSKRKKRTQLFIIYFLMIVTVVSVVGILVLVIQGYRFNKYDGRVEQGGLVQFDSKPSGADVTIDGIALANKTASKITASAGEHTVTIAKPGYNTWSKTVTVKAGTVLWLNYALLLPAKPVVSNVANFAAVASALTSPDHKRMAMIASANAPTIDVATLDSDSPDTAKITLAAGAYTQPTVAESQSFTLLGWDADSRYMLVKHGYDQKQEYLSVDLRGNDQTKNITASLGVDATKIEYALSSSNTVYMLTSTNELRRADLSNATLSGPLISNVADFTQADKSTVSYESLPDPASKRRTVGYLSSGASKAQAIADYTDAALPKIRINTYYGERYIVIAHSKVAEIYKAGLASSDAGSAPKLRKFAEFDVPADSLAQLGFSGKNSRFVYAQTQTTIATYDLELNRAAKIDQTAATSRPVTWVDEFHVALNAGGKIYLYDFDGTNGQLVAASASDLPTAISDNDKYMYYFIADTTGTKLTRLDLRAH